MNFVNAVVSGTGADDPTIPTGANYYRRCVKQNVIAIKDKSDMAIIAVY
jgi:hypothetical protein